MFIYPKPASSLVQGLYTQQDEIDSTVQKKMGKLIARIQTLPISPDAKILDIGSQNGVS
jgi:hypothetical protein